MAPKNIIIPQKHSSAPNVKSLDRCAIPWKRITVVILVAVMATRKHRQGSTGITVK